MQVSLDSKLSVTDFLRDLSELYCQRLFKWAQPLWYESVSRENLVDEGAVDSVFDLDKLT